MRKQPYQAILNATKVADPLAAVLGNFGPTVDKKVVFDDYDKRGERGDFIQRPYLVGNNNYEAGLFKILGIQRNISAQEWCLFDAALFTCPVSQAAAYRAKQEVNTFRYRYYGDFPNLALTNAPPLGPSGAWHGSEIPIIWKTAVDASQAPDTPAEAKISQYLHGVWAAFAKNPENALYEDRYNYPQYNAKSKLQSPPSSFFSDLLFPQSRGFPHKLFLLARTNIYKQRNPSLNSQETGQRSRSPTRHQRIPYVRYWKNSERHFQVVSVDF
jgi:cholinesterase